MKIVTTPFYKNESNILEIGVDEAGRGPLFGRVYTAAVILPKEGFDYTRMKDSKRFHSEKKIIEEEEYIKNNSLYWSVMYSDEKRIDTLNILHATIESMHKCINEVIKNVNTVDKDKEYFILVDGNYFTEYSYLNENDEIKSIEHVTIKGGDDKYSAISAASILAKCARDRYIKELCEKHPLLDERYSIMSNKGYGAKLHIEGLKKHGISQFHRLSYKTCQDVELNNV